MNNTIPVSVIIMTKNEQRNIAKCLRSVSDFAEVFVVDSNSSDDTCKIAEATGASVVNFTWNGKYPKKKQWCLENLPFSYDWVLYLDADEELYPGLVDEIRARLIPAPAETGFFVSYDYAFLGKTLKHGHRIYKLVLFNRHQGRFLDYDDLDVANMWEVEGHYQPKLAGKAGVLKNRMLHNDQDPLYHFINKLNKYSDWEAALRIKGTLRHGEQAALSPLRLLMQRVGDRLPCRGAAMFCYSYILKLGILDGKAGLYYALVLAYYHSFINMKIFETRHRNSIL
ncbi:MAG: glycosyltransferase family 2 protein [Gammaproteobacteria bacterium]|nr:glycosyltransferase family 2 protein [Gammaproteobacteria bacterium]